MKLTDLEICNRIAEIEGAIETLNSISKPASLTAIFSNRTSFDYNPLTDDALCFHLMVKYDILFWQSNGRCCAKQRNTNMSVQRFKSPNKAICLAIIEVHKEK